MIPPIWIDIRVRWIWVPVPVVLLWPLLALIWVVLGLALSVLLLGRWGRPSDVGGVWVESWRLLCGLRGTRIDIEQARERVKISIV